jgi:hypothetical protein
MGNGKGSEQLPERAKSFNAKAQGRNPLRYFFTSFEALRGATGCLPTGYRT